MSYGWIKKGEDKKVGTTASRTRLNIICALKLEENGRNFVASYPTINAEAISEHLRLVRKQHGPSGTVYLILDRTPYHRAEIITKEAEKLNIKIEFFPAYSPNLNPIERLWKVMNEKIRNNRLFKGAKDFRQEIDRFFN